MDWQTIYHGMAQRWRPEDAAKAASILLPQLGLRVRGAYLGGPHWERYGAPGFRGHSVDLSIVQRLPGLPDNPDAAVAFLRQFTGLTSGDLRDRIPAPLRKAAGITISRRQFMKRCRILLALERKQGRSVERGAFVRWTRVALSGWAVDITLPQFMALTPETRAFVAYYVARRQRQSVFSGSGQDPAWDKIAAALFEYAVPSYAVALAFPDQRVLLALTDAERGQLLIGAYRELRDMATVMRRLWTDLGANRDTMIVRRGMNSSDWNAIAGAWNAVRSAWVALLYACGRDGDLATFCPGKAMRLMAADVAAWHRMNGEDEGPDVKVFKQVPLPWDVVLGHATCTAGDVHEAQRSAGVAKDTWTTARTTGKPVATKVTQALVHGVAVSDPELAGLLRRAGWFSAKTVNGFVGGVEVERDERGFALKAHGA